MGTGRDADRDVDRDSDREEDPQARTPGGAGGPSRPREPSGQAVVSEVGFDVAHDSDGLLIVTLRFPNGAHAQLPLEGAAIARVLERLGLASIRELIGRPFSELAPALPVNEPIGHPADERRG